MSSQHSGTLVRWEIDGKAEGIGYFQKWSLPVPGDHVIIDGDEDLDIPKKTVEVIRRVVQQPERDTPFFKIIAKTVETETLSELVDAVEVLKEVASTAQYVVRANGEYSGRERIKDWFSYDTLEAVIRTAEKYGWKRDKGES